MLKLSPFHHHKNQKHSEMISKKKLFPENGWEEKEKKIVLGRGHRTE